MEGTKQILVYPPQFKQQIQQYSKRLPIEQFKKIDAQRIKAQFNVRYSQYMFFKIQIIRIKFAHFTFNKTRVSKDIATSLHNHNRVICDKIKGFYVNASLMRSVLGNKIYAIFAQAPVKKVVDHFWAACYEYKVKKIVMLCSFQDPNRGRQAERYWPLIGETINFQNIDLAIKCLSEEKLDPDYVKTIISIKGKQGEQKIQHIHWTGWADMKKPLGQKNQTLFQNLVFDCLNLINKQQIFLVHCSAGIGRTGTLGTMIEALRCANQQKKLSIFQIVDNMRRYRMASVQTLDQYKFVYQTLAKLL